MPSPPTRIHLVTPGETFGAEQARWEGSAESPLTSWGRYRTSLLGAELGTRPFDSLSAGPGRASRETAAILAAGRGLSVQVEASLSGFHLEAWEGRPVAELASGDPERWRDYQERSDRFRSDQGEGFADAGRRALDFLVRLARTWPGGQHVVVLPAVLAASMPGVRWVGQGEPLPAPLSLRTLVSIAGDPRGFRSLAARSGFARVREPAA